MSLIITGCNEEPKYLGMKDRLIKSIRANSPEQEVQDIVFVGYSREESAVARVKLFQRAFQSGWEQVGWLDVDTLVRGPLDEFWADVEPGVLKILYRPTLVERSKFNTGVMAIGKSPGAELMVADWLRGVNKNNKWYRDQKCLWQAWDNSDIGLVPLPMRFNDHHFDKDSVIWHAKGHCREDSRWKRESEKYA